MSDDADLPDTDYESIYGPEALEARRRARYDVWWQQMQGQHAALERQMQALLERTKSH
jgi:hypothetical protein